MSVFEERLWQELVRDHSDALMYGSVVELPRRPRRHSRLLAAAATLAAAAVALALWLGGGSSQPAYAVTQHADGTVTVTIRTLVGVQGADAKLAELGVPIRTVAVEAGCRVNPRELHPARISPKLVEQLRRGARPGAASVEVQPDAIPGGYTLLLAARRLGHEIGLHEALYKGSAPPCLPLPAAG